MAELIRLIDQTGLKSCGLGNKTRRRHFRTSGIDGKLALMIKAQEQSESYW
jgi:hypothetical protein